MLDRFEEARALARPATERGREFGLDDPDIFFAEIALIEGDWETAASSLQRACELQEASGNTGHLSTYAPRLGNVLCTLGRYEEAERLALTGRELGPPDDVLTQQEWRRTLALVRSAQGEHAEAEQLAREAVQFALQTDSPLYQGNTFSDLATVLEAAGRRDEAITSLHQALEYYEDKPIIPLARRVRERLAANQKMQA
jgi:tetratricopeptide (TPR) repeat protein